MNFLQTAKSQITFFIFQVKVVAEDPLGRCTPKFGHWPCEWWLQFLHTPNTDKLKDKLFLPCPLPQLPLPVPSVSKREYTLFRIQTEKKSNMKEASKLYLLHFLTWKSGIVYVCLCTHVQSYILGQKWIREFSKFHKCPDDFQIQGVIGEKEPFTPSSSSSSSFLLLWQW